MEQIKSKTNKSSVLHYIIIFASIIFLLNAISSRSDQAYNLIKFRTYTVLSGSMEPKLYPGDMIVVTKTNTSKLQPNDIITFKMNDEIVTHRIIEKTQDGFRTKGDNNNVQDLNTVKPENIIGKVSFDIPKVGYITQFLSQGWVVGLEIAILGIVVLFYSKSERDKEIIQ